MISELLTCINDLTLKIDQIEKDIQKDTEKVVKGYIHSSRRIGQGQNYFLSGIHYGVPAKSYLLTSKGIEVLGEETIKINEFIDKVLNFASNPKRKVEVLRDLVIHLQKIQEMIPVSSR